MADPKLSVIVVCLNSPDVRELCLNALTSQSCQEGMEILVVGHGKADHTFKDKGTHLVRWISASPDATVPQMRTLGILQSRGERIALLEDDCAVPGDWFEAVVRTDGDAYPIVGGAVAPGEYRRFLDWGVYFCEYGRFMPPFSGAQNALPGNHVIYKKVVLPALEQGEGFYEVFFHDSWQRSGGRLIADPTLEVANINHWSGRHITGVPFHHGRAFAGMRSQSFSFWRKVVYTVLSLVLPIVKTARLTSVVLSRKRYQVQFFLSLPWVLIFFSSWSLGELVGYAAGPGRSHEQWR